MKAVASSNIMTGESLRAEGVSTIKNADNIVVLENGSILAQGRQEELLAGCPLYRKMWESHIGAKNWSVGKQGKEAEANV